MIDIYLMWSAFLLAVMVYFKAVNSRLFWLGVMAAALTIVGAT